MTKPLFYCIIKTLVCPHLECAVAIWSLHWRKDIGRLEAEQNPPMYQLSAIPARPLLL